MCAVRPSFETAWKLIDGAIYSSLQEVAPLAYSFVGGCFLNPYISRFGDALNLAALRFDDERSNATSSDTQTAYQPKKPYGLVKAGNVGYTAILLFARDPDRIKDLQEAEVGFGAADMGNKGAVGLRCLFEGENDGGESELTFVATHLAAMEWNLARRNANWAAIMRGMAFENPEVVVSEHRASSAGHNIDNDDDGERQMLLHEEHNEEHQRLRRRLHDISIFKPSSHLFVAGDLNYRISSKSPPPGAAFPSLDPGSQHYYMRFWPFDQLTREKGAGRTLHGLSEGVVKFAPTYKYVIKPGTKDSDENPAWSFAPHRYPSWTDRVLYLDAPRSARPDKSVTVRAYDACPVLATSDHRAVFLRASVPLISPADMERLLHEGGEADDASDPRVRLPVELDPEAWERRAAARRREVMAGYSMMLWSTQQGAILLGTIALLGAGWYWFSSWRTD